MGLLLQENFYKILYRINFRYHNILQKSFLVRQPFLNSGILLALWIFCAIIILKYFVENGIKYIKEWGKRYDKRARQTIYFGN